MARTTATNIKKIIEVDTTIVPADADFIPFIDTANEIVTEMCTGTNGPATKYTDTRLELIERWLAAHFYAIRDPRAKSEKAGSVGINYQGKVDLNLSVTTYGQQAMMIDTHGGLSKLNSGKSPAAAVLWLGTEAT